MQMNVSSIAIDQAAVAARRRSDAGLVLPAVLDMRAARTLKASLDQIYNSGQGCVIDGQEVARLSTGCIQILAAFLSSMACSKNQVILRSPSAALLDGFDQLGLSIFLEHCDLES